MGGSIIIDRIVWNLPRKIRKSNKFLWMENVEAMLVTLGFSNLKDKKFMMPMIPCCYRHLDTSRSFVRDHINAKDDELSNIEALQGRSSRFIESRTSPSVRDLSDDNIAQNTVFNELGDAVENIECRSMAQASGEDTITINELTDEDFVYLNVPYDEARRLLTFDIAMTIFEHRDGHIMLCGSCDDHSL